MDSSSTAYGILFESVDSERPHGAPLTRIFAHFHWSLIFAVFVLSTISASWSVEPNCEPGLWVLFQV